MPRGEHLALTHGLVWLNQDEPFVGAHIRFPLVAGRQESRRYE